MREVSRAFKATTKELATTWDQILKMRVIRMIHFQQLPLPLLLFRSIMYCSTQEPVHFSKVVTIWKERAKARNESNFFGLLLILVEHT